MGGPDREVKAVLPLHLGGMGAQLIIAAKPRAFTMEIQLLFCKVNVFHIFPFSLGSELTVLHPDCALDNCSLPFLSPFVHHFHYVDYFTEMIFFTHADRETH